MRNQKELVAVIKEGAGRGHLRTLVLLDDARQRWYHVSFSHPYDQAESKDVVRSLFDSSIAKIRSERRTVFCPSELPILQSVGRWKVTLITRHTNGDISIQDGTSGSVDRYLGIGG